MNRTGNKHLPVYQNSENEDVDIDDQSEIANSMTEGSEGKEVLSDDVDSGDDFCDDDKDDDDDEDDDDDFIKQKSTKKRHISNSMSSGLSAQQIKTAKLARLSVTSYDNISSERDFSSKSIPLSKMKKRNEELKANIFKNSHRRKEFLRSNWRLLAPFLDLNRQSCPDPCSAEMEQEFKKYKFPALTTQPICLSRNVQVKDYQLDGINWVR